MPDVIDRFIGPNEPGSNFMLRPVVFAGIEWPTREHAYQAFKSRDPDDWAMILADPDPGRSKKMGRKVKMRPHWDEFKIPLMQQIQHSFFRQHTDCRQWLFSTWPLELIEGNTWHDQIWGNCICGSGTCNRPGRNLLGQAHMYVRHQLSIEFFDEAEAAGMPPWPGTP